MIVAIDGPAGAGKSTVALRVAEALGFQLLDTGAIYRAVAWMARQREVSWDDAEALAEVARGLSMSFELRDGVNAVLLGAARQDITRAIRTPEMGTGASTVAAHPPVRAALLELQQRIGRSGDTVVEGRDIGTVVFPEAELKVYLTASVHERALRRRGQLQSAHVPGDPPLPELAQLEREIQARDERDTNRAVSPLRRAKDAVLVDATEIDADAVIERILTLARQRRGAS